MSADKSDSNSRYNQGEVRRAPTVLLANQGAAKIAPATVATGGKAQLQGVAKPSPSAVIRPPTSK